MTVTVTVPLRLFSPAAHHAAMAAVTQAGVAERVVGTRTARLRVQFTDAAIEGVKAGGSAAKLRVVKDALAALDAMHDACVAAVRDAALAKQECPLTRGTRGTARSGRFQLDVAETRRRLWAFVYTATGQRDAWKQSDDGCE